MTEILQAPAKHTHTHTKAHFADLRSGQIALESMFADHKPAIVINHIQNKKLNYTMVSALSNPFT